MKDVKKILVPVDFSENSAHALDYAAELARRFGATVEVLHVWDVPSLLPQDVLVTAGSGAIKLVDLVQSSAEAELKAFVSRGVQRGVAIARTRAEPGLPSRVILEAAKSGEYDLIVMGTRGRSGLSDVLLGSVAERVVRRATCPVVTIRSAEHLSELGKARRILVPVDFSDGEFTALECAAVLARKTGARLDAIHAWHMPTFIPPSVFVHTGSDEVRLAAYLEDQSRAKIDVLAAQAAERDVVISERRVERGEPFQVIVDIAKADGYDLIVMATRERSGVSRFLLGSVAGRVLRHAPCPVMTVSV